MAALVAVAAAACSGDLDVKESEADAGTGGTSNAGGSGGMASAISGGPDTTSSAVGGSGATGGAPGAGGSGGAVVNASTSTAETGTANTSTTGGSEPSCLNGVHDGAETDVDCGGPCVPCPTGGRCEQADHCESHVCDDGFCGAPSCDDQVLNGAETDVDCGGEVCGPCPELCECALSERLSLLNCGSTTIAGTGWQTPGLLSADGSVFVFTRCIGPDPVGGQCGEFDVMRKAGEQAIEPLGAGIFSEVMTPDGEHLVLTDYEFDGMRLLTPEGEEAIDLVGRAAAISEDGEVLAVTNYSDSDGQAGRWTREGGFEALGDIPDGTGVSHATDMSADGSVIVGYARTGTQEVPFIWREGTLESLTDLPGDATTARALRVSDDGSTMVGVTAVWTSSEFRPLDVFRWTEAEGFSVIAPVCGELCPEWLRVRVNEDGSVVAASLELPAEGEGAIGQAGAFRWTESDGLVQLSLDSATPSTVHDISADGAVIVGQIGPVNVPGPAYVWDEASGMQPLGELLEAGGVETTGWDLSGGETQVSADGNVVIGVGSCGGTRALYRAVLSED